MNTPTRFVTRSICALPAAGRRAAYGSIRMEPVFMILGQSAATAAVLALEEATAPQKLAYQKLRQALLRDKQRLE